MKIALFSDVHANFPAFEAFLADAERQQVDAIYCLGDLIGYNIWPNEVINELRRRGIAAIRGNHDLKNSGYAYELVSEQNRQFLATLPAHLRLEYRLNNDHLTIVMAHGSIRSVNEYLLEDLEESYVLDMMKEAKADILCVGHSHKPYHRIIKDGDNFKHIINTGSVGKPKDGNPKACYVLLTLNGDSSSMHPDTVRVEFIRIPYDIDKAVNGIKGSPLPDDLAERLINAN
ncbi:YfcE family phosphodiesterase [Flavobacterium sp. Sd200]|uniref:metallophosphoesterase family protein n=1 Tax=Flavobacterium sp. Sd200 TaxID=2692211 RepID=UPI00136AD165|nr:metallophosphoesterase family protein [Flavobacterium sp. Sd200]MXN93272.1 YfcE family phosphodiesterase [Flavobacterium sp. Sd200]